MVEFLPEGIRIKNAASISPMAELTASHREITKICPPYPKLFKTSKERRFVNPCEKPTFSTALRPNQALTENSRQSTSERQVLRNQLNRRT
jgi:hypothetical protein